MARRRLAPPAGRAHYGRTREDPLRQAQHGPARQRLCRTACPHDSPGFAGARSAPIFVKAHLTALAGATASICQLGMHISGTAEASQAHLLALTPFEEHADPNSRAAALTGTLQQALPSGRTPPAPAPLPAPPPHPS